MQRRRVSRVRCEVDLGVRLRESPFYEALKGADATILMLDPAAEAGKH